MAHSVFHIFKIGIGPSSSHTVGPMKAACAFATHLQESGVLDAVRRVRVELFGSLGATGKGHGTDRAVLMGLEGELPDRVDPASITPRMAAIAENAALALLGTHRIAFQGKEDLIFNRTETMPLHSNGMHCQAFAEDGSILSDREYYSVGGGFIVDATGLDAISMPQDAAAVPYPFRTAKDLLDLCEKHGFAIHELMMENEKTWMPEEEVRAGILRIWQVFQDCIQAGLTNDGELPGGLRVKRRAPGLHRELIRGTNGGVPKNPLEIMDWVNMYAMAVNEENAAGGRVVTAPTNGAAGIVPAVLQYYMQYVDGANEEGLLRFMLTAGAICILYMENASISGAEVGCQGEVGVACSMAAGGLTSAFGGTNGQIENAAEIGMEHNLGLTCDPIGGLVQIPCIERNAIGSIKAINAARMAMHGDGTHFVSLDKVIATMLETGRDMQTKYKETSRGGLALNVGVNVTEC